MKKLAKRNSHLTYLYGDKLVEQQIRQGLAKKAEELKSDKKWSELRLKILKRLKNG